MTLERDNIVRLSARDWIAIAGIATGICIAVLGAFMHHDRLLMQVVTEQQSINRRLDKIETKIENNRN
jgi:hypothetical protein